MFLPIEFERTLERVSIHPVIVMLPTNTNTPTRKRDVSQSSDLMLFHILPLLKNLCQTKEITANIMHKTPGR